MRRHWNPVVGSLMMVFWIAGCGTESVQAPQPATSVADFHLDDGIRVQLVSVDRSLLGEAAVQVMVHPPAGEERSYVLTHGRFASSEDPEHEMHRSRLTNSGGEVVAAQTVWVHGDQAVVMRVEAAGETVDLGQRITGPHSATRLYRISDNTGKRTLDLGDLDYLRLSWDVGARKRVLYRQNAFFAESRAVASHDLRLLLALMSHPRLEDALAKDRAQRGVLGTAEPCPAGLKAAAGMAASLCKFATIPVPWLQVPSAVGCVWGTAITVACGLIDIIEWLNPELGPAPPPGPDCSCG